MSSEGLVERMTGQSVRVQVPNVGTVTGFLRRESAEYLAGIAATPTPVPSEVAETTAGEREVEALDVLIGAREELREVYRVGSERRQNLSDLTRRLDENARQIADALTPALLDRVRREEGEKVLANVEHHLRRYGSRGGNSPQWPYAAIDRARDDIARAASVGRGEEL